MFDLSLVQLAKKLRGSLINSDGNVFPTGACIDTRRLNPGELFFALVGEKSDGHNYLEQAAEKGAMGAVVTNIPHGFIHPDFPLIIVQDATVALHETASLQRRNFSGPVIAVTGSTGKTTTRDMLTAILREKGPVLAPHGNYNNELGLPLTILNLKKEHWAIVLEMGMRGLGEIDFLARIGEPEYGIITNIGHTHQELLGSKERIAQAKAELLSHIPGDGGLVLNTADKEILKPWLSNIRSRICWIGTMRPADLWAENVQVGESCAVFSIVSPEGEVCRINLPVPGRHNILNALSAAGAARYLKLPWEKIKNGLENTSLTPMRLEIKRVENLGLTIINDTYNANPASMQAALDVLADMTAGNRKIAVLGDMYELGDYSDEGHKIVGKKAKAVDIAYLITVGCLAEGIAKGAVEKGFDKGKIKSCHDNQEALFYLKRLVNPGDIILIKGSRGVKMEEITAGLMLDD